MSATSRSSSAERISSAPAESGLSHIVKEQLGKRKPIRWSADGTNLMLQVRCAVLDDRLDRVRSVVPALPANAPDDWDS